MGLINTYPCCGLLTQSDESKHAETQYIGGGRVRKQVAFENGAVYTGEWLGDARDGYGVQVWDDGAR